MREEVVLAKGIANIKVLSFKKGMLVVDIIFSMNTINFWLVNMLPKNGGVDFCQN